MMATGVTKETAVDRPAGEQAGTRRPTVAVCTVTYNSSHHLQTWWQALCSLQRRLGEQSAPFPIEVRVIAVDCNSDDKSVALLKSFREDHEGPPLAVLECKQNLGFAGGMNRAFAALDENDRWLFAVNPDARPAAESLHPLLAAFEGYLPVDSSPRGGHPFRVGSVTGRLVRPPTDAGATTELDACGMYWTGSWRHFDRGSGEPNDGRYCQPQEVFAGTGAGTLFLVEALRDVALPSADRNDQRDQVFDQDFHSFREDAELGLRLQRRGWSCIYEPAALIEHHRHNLPQRRRQMSTSINQHSLKNRYLLRILHQTPANALRTLPALVRDLVIPFYVLVREPSSLVAYSWLWRNRSRLVARRHWLQRRQTVDGALVDRWFRLRSLPLQTR